MEIELNEIITLYFNDEHIYNFTQSGLAVQNSKIGFKVKIKGYDKYSWPYFRWHFYELECFLEKYASHLLESFGPYLFTRKTFIVKRWNWESVYSYLLKVLDGIELPLSNSREDIELFLLKIDAFFDLPMRDDAYWTNYQPKENTKSKVKLLKAYTNDSTNSELNKVYYSLDEYTPWLINETELCLLLNITFPSGTKKEVYCTLITIDSLRKKYKSILQSTNNDFEFIGHYLIFKFYVPDEIMKTIYNFDNLLNDGFTEDEKNNWSIRRYFRM